MNGRIYYCINVYVVLRVLRERNVDPTTHLSLSLAPIASRTASFFLNRKRRAIRERRPTSLPQLAHSVTLPISLLLPISPYIKRIETPSSYVEEFGAKRLPTFDEKDVIIRDDESLRFVFGCGFFFLFWWIRKRNYVHRADYKSRCVRSRINNANNPRR